MKALDSVAKKRGQNIGLSFDEVRSKSPEVYADIEGYFGKNDIDLKLVDDSVVDRCFRVYQTYNRYLIAFEIILVNLYKFKMTMFSILLDHPLQKIENALPANLHFDGCSILFYNMLVYWVIFSKKFNLTLTENEILLLLVPLYVYLKKSKSTRKSNLFHLKIIEKTMKYFEQKLKLTSASRALFRIIFFNLNSNLHRPLEGLEIFEDYISRIRSDYNQFFVEMENHLNLENLNKKTALLSSSRIYYQTEFKK